MLHKIILASRSKYRRALLDKLNIAYEWQAADIDESAKNNENASELVLRLCKEKAATVARRCDTDAIIIAADQVAAFAETILNKPGSHEKAVQQLLLQSGKKVTFFTGLAVMQTSTAKILSSVESYHVLFRPLQKAEIERYCAVEKPYDCAGSFKSEGLGISLFSVLQGDDPNTLIGLPLIKLCSFLRQFSLQLP